MNNLKILFSASVLLMSFVGQVDAYTMSREEFLKMANFNTMCENTEVLSCIGMSSKKCQLIGKTCAAPLPDDLTGAANAHHLGTYMDCIDKVIGFCIGSWIVYILLDKLIDYIIIKVEGRKDY